MLMSHWSNDREPCCRVRHFLKPRLKIYEVKLQENI